MNNSPPGPFWLKKVVQVGEGWSPSSTHAIVLSQIVSPADFLKAIPCSCCVDTEKVSQIQVSQVQLF